MEHTTELTHCPSCNVKLNANIFTNNKLKDSSITTLINAYKKEDIKEAYCEKCFEPYFEDAIEKWKKEIAGINRTIPILLDSILIVTSIPPANWEYDLLGMVTGQSTTGTGAFTEIKSSFADLLGGQANTYNKKLQEGETLCQAQLRLKCLEMGGNAVISADIDYAEVGGERGMIMVCIAGTAVKLNNTDVLDEKKESNLNKLRILVERKKELLALYNSGLNTI